jgi:hypothetical protein
MMMGVPHWFKIEFLDGPKQVFSTYHNPRNQSQITKEGKARRGDRIRVSCEPSLYQGLLIRWLSCSETLFLEMKRSATTRYPASPVSTVHWFTEADLCAWFSG